MSAPSTQPDLSRLLHAVDQARRPLLPPSDGTGRGLPTVEEAERLVAALRDLDDLVATVYPGRKDAAD